MEDIKPRNLNGSKVINAQTKRLGFFILIKLFKKINFFKVTSALVAAIFFWNQIAWARDIAVNTIEKLNDSQSQTFAPNYLRKQTALHEDIVNQKQLIEDLVKSFFPCKISPAYHSVFSYS